MIMPPLIRIRGIPTVFFYVLFLFLAITTIYTVFFQLDPPHSLALDLPPLWSTSPLSFDSLIKPKSPSLRHLCDTADWTEGLWLHCHNGAGPSQTAIRGGLSNLRNRIQTCLRLAISAGAGIILPTIATRDESDLFEYPKEQCPGALWNIDLFQQSLSTTCPQLSIRACNDTSGIDVTLEAKFRKYLDPSHSLGTFRTFIDDTIAKNGFSRPVISAQKPVRVMYGDPYLAWNYTASSETRTKKDLFKVLQYNTTLLKLGKQVFDALKKKSSGPIVAIHLRGEADWPKSFGELGMQINLHTKALQKLRKDSQGNTDGTIFKDVYVSCGNANATATFRARLELLGYVVHDKTSLLNDNTDILEKIMALKFDEKAITEYESLVSADYFMGILTSSLSAIISYARTSNENGDYFEKFIHPGTTRTEFIGREFPDSPSVRGNEQTKLIVLTGPDIMDCFP